MKSFSDFIKSVGLVKKGDGKIENKIMENFGSLNKVKIFLKLTFSNSLKLIKHTQDFICFSYQKISSEDAFNFSRVLFLFQKLLFVKL